MAKARFSARLGPRPLVQHLLLASATWLSAGAVLPSLSGASPRSKTVAEGLGRLSPELAAASTSLLAALDAEGRRRFGEWLAGIEAYRRHPYRPPREARPILWQEGTTRLLDYAEAGSRKSKSVRARVLVIPSLINRYHVLDLEAGNSFIRWLAAAECDPCIVDWGAPGEAESGFTLTDYIAGRLERALDFLQRKPHGPVFLLGYCMGGDLALALALRRQRQIAGLILLATPWDFHAGGRRAALALAALGRSLAPIIEALGEMPVDLLQSLFTALDPIQGLRKFQTFAALPGESALAHRFVALEDWLNDGVPLAGAVALECFAGWYGRNDPANRRWRVAGRIVDPGNFSRPSLAVVPGADRIVPPASALALGRALPGADILQPPLGHIGMMVGSQARAAVWEPLRRWIADRQALPSAGHSS